MLPMQDENYDPFSVCSIMLLVQMNEYLNWEKVKVKSHHGNGKRELMVDCSLPPPPPQTNMINWNFGGFLFGCHTIPLSPTISPTSSLAVV
jgi:hypothetical protein